MRVVVDLNRCQAYAQCCFAAPESFALHGPEVLVYDAAPPPERRREIERAVQACPVRAILLEVEPEEAGSHG
ncbi:ferredoxin protein [Methylobacterium sp. 4-46]|uniref:ferredoxin n=1 Tax=unclassified Methylobacterium TaxID=2615210 RepID=UPI000152DAD7|nr:MULTISPECIES: ferredoxin [Methylobacterium]ACA18941.1 ferredoxin protein [Methylobacterium sp. 4-46]WFT78164.1 ferredoxin [Methylobacterium nodulans]